MKRLTDWTVEDIERLILEQVPEDAHLEFKGALATSKGHDDQWLVDQTTVGDTARNDLMKEAIAFANSAGGIIILGAKEHKQGTPQPNTIERIQLLPECIRLAEVLRLGCRDLVDPKIDDIRFRGLPLQNDAGLVLVGVQQSRHRPHRHTKTKECYIRRTESSVAMTMDEIKDLTLYAVTQEQRIDSQFLYRSTGLDNAMQRKLASAEIAAIRCILVPLQDILLPQIARNVSMRHNTRVFPLTIRWSDGGVQGVQANFVYGDGNWRPILRGLQSVEEDDNFVGVRQIFENGSVASGLAVRYAMLHTQHRFHIGWTLALVANAIYTAQLFQKTISATDISYGVELQVITKGRDYSLVNFGDADSGQLPIGTMNFPRYQLDGPEEVSALLTQIDQDLWNYTQHDFLRSIEVDSRYFD